MVLVNSLSQIRGNTAATQPSAVPEGSLWYDTVTDTLKASDGTTYNPIGATSFSTAAVVSQSTTITDYTTPTTAVVSGTNGGNITSPYLETDVSSTSATLSSSYDQRGGLQILTGHAAVGQYYTTIKIWLRKQLSPTGTGTLNIRNSAQTIKATETSTLDVSTISGTSTEYTFTIVTPVIVAADDRIQFEYSGGNATNYIEVKAQTATSEANTKTTSYSGTTQTDATTSIPAMTITVNDTGYSSAYIFDDNTLTQWSNSAATNPYVYVDMNTTLNLCALAFYFNSSLTTETEIKIQTSINASTWTDKRTVTVSNLTNAAWNYYRFNIAGGARYVRIYGNSGASTILGLWEIKVLSKTDAQIIADLGILEISASDTSLGADGT